MNEGEKTCIRSGYCLYKPTPETCNKNCPYYVDSGKRRESDYPKEN